MSSESENPNLAVEEEGKAQSKKAAKKEAAKLEKQRRRQEAAAAVSSVSDISIGDTSDPLASNYGDVPLVDLQSKEVSGLKWTDVGALNEDLKDQKVLIRGRAQTIRAVGKNIAFVVVRQMGFTVQCVLTVVSDIVSRQMVKYATSLSRESHVDIEGIISVPGIPIKGATQQVGFFFFFFI